MSGGVDSSVAALCMLEKGYRLEGTTMRLYKWDGKYRPKTRTCCTDRDMNDASEVAVKLGIPYTVTDYQEVFRTEVIEKFIRVYEEGGTPNPCIDCNRYLKFDRLLALAREKELNYIVTGHYARIERDETGRCHLRKAVDRTKDQSYVLFNLTQEQLRHTLFPLGEMTKDEVRQIAAEHGFVNAEKKDSQDICFIPDGDYASFIEKYTHTSFVPGHYLNTDGEVIGTHQGAIRYTIGQRKGLGVAFGEPMFVCDKSMEDNTVTLAREDAVFKTTLIADDLNWIAFDSLRESIRVRAKTRYRAKEADATVYPGEDGRVKVVFDEKQRAMTIGQAVVFYDGDEVVGGGTILSVTD
ncbi:MAG: tRNA 2-thiouridine(34) synthase MnmA [Eubacterium sp.]|nr:tRNA 2-thiouridine(34) synthase MnmA [Eubacterium sp.]